jgi:acetyl-CoA carboxylase biotin carboxyl carrier protein
MKGGKRERASGKATNGPSGTPTSGPSGKSERRGNPEHPTVELARQLAAIVESHSLAELVIDTPDLTLTLRRGQWMGGAAVGPMVAASAAPALPPAPMAAARASGMEAQPASASGGSAPAAAPAKPEPDYHVVTSPFVGTFYRSPTPDSDPYVVEGQRIEKGQVLCIVEAMKLMNEIEADTAGVVVSVLVDNSQPVEYGQPLFRLAPP